MKCLGSLVVQRKEEVVPLGRRGVPDSRGDAARVGFEAASVERVDVAVGSGGEAEAADRFEQTACGEAGLLGRRARRRCYESH